MKTRQGDSLFLKVDVGGETVRVSGRSKNWRSVWKRVVTTFRRAKSKPGWNSIFPALVKVDQGNNGYKTVKEFLPEAAD
jgi:hypothetical protein